MRRRAYVTSTKGWLIKPTGRWYVEALLGCSCAHCHPSSVLGLQVEKAISTRADAREVVALTQALDSKAGKMCVVVLCGCCGPARRPSVGCRLSADVRGEAGVGHD